MGLLRKKDKSAMSYREEPSLERGLDQRNSAPPMMGRKENVDNSDSGPIYDDDQSSANSKTTGASPTPRANNRKDTSKGSWFTSRQVRLFNKPPPAEQAAYSGPPRYDWVDIVSWCRVATCYRVSR